MTDPICGMNVEPDRAAGSYEHNGQTYYFCSQHCLAKFKEDPEKFLKSPAAGQTAHGHGHAHGIAPTPGRDKPEHGVYVCPMDPEVRESKPGACPQVRHGSGAGSSRRSFGEDRIRLSDASGDRASRAGFLPHLRHGA